MKCPKCSYLSFEPEPRCKHCGYDLSIADADLAIAPVDTTSAPLDLRLRDDDVLTSPPARVTSPRASQGGSSSVTMPLRSGGSVALADSPPPRPAAPRVEPRPSLRAESARHTPVPQAAPRAMASRPAAAAPVTTELPLFMKNLGAGDEVVESPGASPATPATTQVPAVSTPGAWMPSTESTAMGSPREPVPSFSAALAEAVGEEEEDASDTTPVAAQAFSDEPLEVPAAPPPLAVRRRAPDSAPQRARVKAESARKLGPFDRDLLEDLQRIEAEAARRARPQSATDDALPAVDLRRLGAAAIDAAVLGGIGVAGFWFTLRWCDLTLGQAGVLPIAPLVAFFVLIALGYLLMFTAAGGQTIGKMVLGLRVIGNLPDDSADRPSLRQACYRALLTVPSVLALGLGFLPALFGQGLAVHDRLAHTRVVRA